MEFIGVKPQQYHWGYEEREEGEPLRMAILPMSVEVLEHAYFIPSGYKVVGIHYDELRRALNFVLIGDDLPEVQEGCELPRVSLLMTTETLDDHPGYRRYTPEIKTWSR